MTPRLLSIFKVEVAICWDGEDKSGRVNQGFDWSCDHVKFEMPLRYSSADVAEEVGIWSSGISSRLVIKIWES